MPSDKARGYARLAVDILLALLDVDLRPELDRPEQNLAEREAKDKLLEAIRQEKTRLAKQIEAEIRNLSLDLRIVVEGIDHYLVSPSFEQWFTGSLAERLRYCDFLIDEVRHKWSTDDDMMTIEETWEFLKNDRDDGVLGVDFLQWGKGFPKPFWEFATTYFSPLDLLRVLSYSSFFGLLSEIFCMALDNGDWYVGWDSEQQAGGKLLDNSWPAIDEMYSLDELNRVLEEVRRTGEQRLKFLQDRHAELTRHILKEAESE